MKLFIFTVIIIIFAICPTLRCALSHPILTIKYLILDIYKYFKYKRWRECKFYGKIICATALFGGGKTLSTTMILRWIYNKYNGLMVYDFKDNVWREQKIKIISNVDFSDIPYYKLKSSDDIIHANDNEPFTTVSLVFIDEASTQFNSRNFKTNLPTELLSQILCCRHHKIGIFLSSQRFAHMDKLLREVTSTVHECKKTWRFLKYDIYDAWSIENCTNLSFVKPLSTRCLFIKDSDFNAYDTYAIVENFKHQVEKGEILLDNEVLEYREPVQNDLETVTNLNKRGRLRLKKKR